ncbi:MAG: hypothetical protein KJT03_20855 [Verrucomicrobiae bacterium]|nr:hypothetical protein [Verrucomicrobiae bacterium]
MKTKLTLTVEERAVAGIKQLAKQKGVSVSSLFEQWSLRMTAGPEDLPIGSYLRGRWADARNEEQDARLDYLLDKHAR